MKVINLTPHEIVVEFEAETSCQYCGAGEYNPECPECRGTGGPVPSTRTWRIPASGEVVRMTTSQKWVDHVNGFPIQRNEVTGSNLPEPQKDTLLLVSAIVLAAFPERSDLIAPDTGNAKRNEKGHIVSVPGFVCN